jgi:hypothetical protein
VVPICRSPLCSHVNDRLVHPRLKLQGLQGFRGGGQARLVVALCQRNGLKMFQLVLTDERFLRDRRFCMFGYYLQDFVEAILKSPIANYLVVATKTFEPKNDRGTVYILLKALCVSLK